MPGMNLFFRLTHGVIYFWHPSSLNKNSVKNEYFPRKKKNLIAATNAVKSVDRKRQVDNENARPQRYSQPFSADDWRTTMRQKLISGTNTLFHPVKTSPI
ncbi:hypothetical protein [Pantoea sp. OXWO6B1]|uniref:hypothetical protein n=1 Tax=Pantoea sp. OXWO6B1 TaxID=1835724 RepID=UPI0007C6C1D6|nr:hypothetical protein [Pantoea sp. OXWO6B1]OAE08923.1 hypothetical protein A6A26_15485 [Pantoea sp. OXWO6B1]